jgi:hypothetical protein
LLAFDAVALIASFLMTAVYHAGYSDFRSGKVRSPIAGDLIWSTPILLTLNPIGAPLTHGVTHPSLPGQAERLGITSQRGEQEGTRPARRKEDVAVDSPPAMDSISVLSPDQPVLHGGRRATFLRMKRGAAIIRYWGDSHAVSVPPEALSLPESRSRRRPLAAHDEPTTRERATTEKPAA